MAIKKILKRFFAVFLLIFVTFGLFSCGAGEPMSAQKVLTAMLSAEKELPAGKTYLLKSSKGSPDYISESLLAALYGGTAFPEAHGRTEDMALRLSSGLCCFEMAVFLCPTVRDAREIADLCLGRIDSMEHFVNANSEKLGISPLSVENLKKARVNVVGRYVIMAVSPNADEAVKGAKNAIS